MVENTTTNIGKTMKDAVSLEFTRPVITRVRNRLKEIAKLSDAKSEKQVVGNMIIWHTTEPEMFISGLSAKIEGGVGIITYHKYKMKDGKKEVRVNKSKSPYTDKDIEISAEYINDCMVIESIERYKPISTKEVRF